MTENRSGVHPETLEKIIWEEVSTSEHLAQYYPLYEAKLRNSHGRAVLYAVGLAVLTGAFLIAGFIVSSTYPSLQTGMNTAGLVSAIASIISSILAHRGEDVKNIALATIAASRWRYMAVQWRMLLAEARMQDGRDVLITWRQLTEEARVVFLETECGPFDATLSERASKNAKDFLKYFKVTDPNQDAS